MYSFTLCNPTRFFIAHLSDVFSLWLSFVLLWIKGVGHRAAKMMNKRELEKEVKYLYLVTQPKPPNTRCTLSLSVTHSPTCIFTCWPGAQRNAETLYTYEPTFKLWATHTLVNTQPHAKSYIIKIKTMIDMPVLFFIITIK